MDDAELGDLLLDYSQKAVGTKESVDALFALDARIKDEPEFAKTMMVVTGTGAYSWLPQIAVQKMATLLHDGKTPAEAVAWMRRVPSLTGCSGAAVKALYGIDCNSAIAISKELALIPYSALPSSVTKEWIVTMHERALDSHFVSGFRQFPSAALIRRGRIEHVLIPSDFDIQHLPTSTWFAELDEAAKLLVLVSNAVPNEAGSWLQCDDPDADYACQFGFTKRGAEFESRVFRTPPLASEAQLVGMWDLMQKTMPDDRKRIVLALERILRSRSQFALSNRAIDLAIAFEVLFMNSDSGEHSYKISLRAAKVVGGDLPARQKTFIYVKRLYDLRSQVVHTGNAKNEFSVGESKVSAHELVEASDAICTNAIREFLHMGGIPNDWRGLELGP